MATRKSSPVNRKYKAKYRIRNWREYAAGRRSPVEPLFRCAEHVQRLGGESPLHLMEVSASEAQGQDHPRLRCLSSSLGSRQPKTAVDSES